MIINRLCMFKDKCDICGKYDYLKGFKCQCLCPECFEKKSKQLTIYDYLETLKE